MQYDETEAHELAKQAANRTERSDGSQQRVVRRCACKYQTSSGGAWGYNLQRWTGNPAWEDMGNATHVADVEKSARKYLTILIRCNGCGMDILREYPPNDLRELSPTGDSREPKTL